MKEQMRGNKRTRTPGEAQRQGATTNNDVLAPSGRLGQRSGD